MAIPTTPPGVRALRFRSATVPGTVLDSGDREPKDGPATSPSQPRVRYPEIDLLKSVAILAVVLIHAKHKGFLRPGSAMEELLQDGCSFAVPAFFFAAGFLFDKGNSPTRQLAAKLTRRILPPYLVCSLLMLVFVAAGLQPGRFVWSEIPERLALGTANGTYYFVFVLGYLYGLSLWLRRWSAEWVYVLFAVSILALTSYNLGALRPPSIPGRWYFIVLLRLPMFYVPAYLAGWIVAMHYRRIREFMASRFALLIIVAAVFDVLIMKHLYDRSLAVGPRPQTLQIAVNIHTGMAVLGLLALGIRYNITAAPLVFLSSASYAIYLLHVPIVQWVDPLFCSMGHGSFPLRMLLTWASSLALTLLLIATIRGILGQRSRFLIGW